MDHDDSERQVIEGVADTGAGRATGQARPMPHGYREADVYAYLQAIYRHRRLAGAAFLITFVTALVYAFAATPMYRATARFLVENRNPRVVTFQEVVPARGGGGAAQFYTTQSDMLRSRTLARTAIERLGLWDHPEFGGVDDAPSSGPLRAVGRVVASARAAILPGPGENVETRRESIAISRLMKNLDIRASRNTRVIEVAFSSRDPELAADVANTLVRAYIERDIEFRYTASREALKFLQQRIAEQRQHLETSEQALQRYREDHGAAAIQDRQNIIVRELEELYSAVTSATMARVESEARYRDLEAIRDELGALRQFPGIRENTIIQEQLLSIRGLERYRDRLTEALGPLHPSLSGVESSIRVAEKQLRSDVAGVVDSLRFELRVATSRERELQAEVDRQTQAVLALDRIGIEYGVMEREAESSRQIYESLLQRAAETAVTGELETTNVRVVDQAEAPLVPAWPPRQLVLLIGLVAGVLLAVGLVLIVEYRDDNAAPRGPSGTASAG